MAPPQASAVRVPSPRDFRGCQGSSPTAVADAAYRGATTARSGGVPHSHLPRRARSRDRHNNWARNSRAAGSRLEQAVQYGIQMSPALAAAADDAGIVHPDLQRARAALGRAGDGGIGPRQPASARSRPCSAVPARHTRSSGSRVRRQTSARRTSTRWRSSGPGLRTGSF